MFKKSLKSLKSLISFKRLKIDKQNKPYDKYEYLHSQVVKDYLNLIKKIKLENK